MSVKIEFKESNTPNQFLKEVMQGIADKTGFHFKTISLKVTGEKNGFKVSVVKQKGEKVAVVMSVGKDGYGPTEEVLGAAHAAARDVETIELQGAKIVFVLKFGTKHMTINRAFNTINALTDFFAGNGYEDTTDIEIVPVVTTYTKAAKDAYINENTFLGIIGAIIGSVVGIGIIFLIAQIGLIAGIGGAVLAMGTLFGYETLAKKLSIKGIVICVIVMIISTYVAEHMIWVAEVEKSVSVYGDTNPIMVTVFLHRILAAAGATGYFVKDLIVLYIFTAFGAVPRIKRRLFFVSESMA